MLPVKENKINRPKIKIEPDSIDKIIEAIGIVGIIFLIALPVYFYEIVASIFYAVTTLLCIKQTKEAHIKVQILPCLLIQEAQLYLYCLKYTQSLL